MFLDRYDEEFGKMNKAVTKNSDVRSTGLPNSSPLFAGTWRRPARGKFKTRT